MFSDFAEPIYFELQTGIHLEDRELLAQAFTHRSFLNEVEDDTLVDNERLEFLGDAVLGFVVSEILFQNFPGQSEGELTRMRSVMVRRETLARVAERYLLGDSLRLGKGEEESGGRRRPATLCAVLEAVIGAVFVDLGIDSARDFVVQLLDDEIKFVTSNAVDKDPKSRLQEYVQSRFGLTPRYRTVDSSGPDHAKLFVQSVNIAKRRVGIGQGLSKQEAAQVAAAFALFRLGQAAPEYVADALLEEQYELSPIEEIWALTLPDEKDD